MSTSSSTSVSNPTGWANIAIDLIQYVGQYVQFRFIMEDNNIGGTDGGKAGWYIDNFRVGDPLPQSADMSINGFLPSASPPVLATVESWNLMQSSTTKREWAQEIRWWLQGTNFELDILLPKLTHLC